MPRVPMRIPLSVARRYTLTAALVLVIAAAGVAILARRPAAPVAELRLEASVRDGGIEFSIRLTKTRFGRSESVTALFTVRNTLDRPVKMGFYNARRHFEVYMYDPGGRLVVIWGDGKDLPPGREVLDLAPGEEQRGTLTWDQTRYDTVQAAFVPVTLGTYRLMGVLLAQFSSRAPGPELITPPVDVVLTP